MSDSDGTVDRSQRQKSPFDISKNLVPTKELIQLVRKRPCLWNRYSPYYNNRVVKDKAWNEIYTHFEPEYDSLKEIKQIQIGAIVTKKWYNVRDSYRKSLRPGYRNIKPYIYADRLKFLKNMFSTRKKPRKEKPEASFKLEQVSNDEGNEEQETWLDEVLLDNDEDNVNTASAATPAKRHKMEFTQPNETQETEESIVAVLANLIEKEEDEDRAFFKSITPAVKSLSDRSKFLFRIQIMKLINTLKCRDRKLSNVNTITNVGSDSE